MYRQNQDFQILTVSSVTVFYLVEIYVCQYHKAYLVCLHFSKKDNKLALIWNFGFLGLFSMIIDGYGLLEKCGFFH